MPEHPAILKIVQAQTIIDDHANRIFEEHEMLPIDACDTLNRAYELLTEAATLIQTDPRLQ